MSLMANETRHGVTSEESTKFQLVMPRSVKGQLEVWSEKAQVSMSALVLTALDKEFIALREAEEAVAKPRRGRPPKR